MEQFPEPRQFELPLELQFSMRKAELAAQELTWDELHAALLNLYYQRLMEWQAIKELLIDENIELNFDIPTDIELAELASSFDYDDDYDDDDDYMEEEPAPF